MKKSINDLLDLMAALRDPKTGCVWDKKQTYESIVPHTLEEAYEVAEVIETRQLDELCNELGDLLFQIVFYSQIAREEGLFDFSDVVDAITNKMIRRHPHVFADEKVSSVEEQKKLWHSIKQSEKKSDTNDQFVSTLDGVNWSMPSQTVAKKLQNKAATVGFEWPDWKGPLVKIDEELQELVEAVNSGNTEEIQSEMGDVLFACVNLARLLGVDPDAALRVTNRKFDKRFRGMEKLATKNGEDFAFLSLEQQEAYWQRIKKELG